MVTTEAERSLAQRWEGRRESAVHRSRLYWHQVFLKIPDYLPNQTSCTFMYFSSVIFIATHIASFFCHYISFSFSPRKLIVLKSETFEQGLQVWFQLRTNSGFQCQSLITQPALSGFMIVTKSLHLNYGLVCRACILLYTIFKYKVKEHEKIRIYDLKNLVLLWHRQTECTCL